MRKYLFSLLTLTVIAVAARSQDTRKKLDQLKQDPATAQKAAKADAQLINKKALADSSKTKTLTGNSQQPVPRLKKKKFLK
jgi:hypothetical protein